MSVRRFFALELVRHEKQDALPHRALQAWYKSFAKYWPRRLKQGARHLRIFAKLMENLGIFSIPLTFTAGKASPAELKDVTQR
tara:strand:- start:266 stop:514 length:249 start_codon:yes stop_codon:yes gene_type:complete